MARINIFLLGIVARQAHPVKRLAVDVVGDFGELEEAAHHPAIGERGRTADRWCRGRKGHGGQPRSGAAGPGQQLMKLGGRSWRGDR
jgi:hypothetical protein